MGLVFIIPVLAIASWIVFSSIRALVRGEVDPIWRRRAMFCFSAGIAIGVWLAFFAKFAPANNAKFQRAPVPTIIEVLDPDTKTWREVVPPTPIRVLAIITDFISGIAAGLLPIKIAAFTRQVKESVGR